MKHNKIFAFLLAGVLSLGIVGCGSAGSSDSSTKQASSSVSGDLKTLRLGSPGFDDYPLLENGNNNSTLVFFTGRFSSMTSSKWSTPCPVAALILTAPPIIGI